MKIHIDGFTIGRNPSDIGGGFTVFDFETQALITRIEKQSSNFTCNEGEMLGLLWAILYADHDSEIYTDSRIAISWLKSGNPKARPDLKGICQQAKEFQIAKNIKVEWIPREQNIAGIFNENLDTEKPLTYNRFNTLGF